MRKEQRRKNEEERKEVTGAGPMLKERRITRFDIVTLDRFAFMCLNMGCYALTPWPWLRDVVKRWVDPETGDYVFLVEEKKDERTKVAE